MLKQTLRVAVLVGTLLVPGIAAAAPALVTADLNIRTGPGTRYQPFATIPGGNRVEVESCLRRYNWCRVFWAGRLGWVSGNYLAYLERGRRAPLPSVGFSIGIPIIEFEFGRGRPDWHDRHWRRRWDRDDYWRWRHRHRWDDDWPRRGPPPPFWLDRD